MSAIFDAPAHVLAEQIQKRTPAKTVVFKRTHGIMTHDGVAMEAGQHVRVYVYKGDTDRIDIQIMHDQLSMATHFTASMARAMADELRAAADAMDAAKERLT